jgi:hypothetical protein
VLNSPWFILLLKLLRFSGPVGPPSAAPVECDAWSPVPWDILACGGLLRAVSGAVVALLEALPHHLFDFLVVAGFLEHRLERGTVAGLLEIDDVTHVPPPPHRPGRSASAGRPGP